MTRHFWPLGASDYSFKAKILAIKEDRIFIWVTADKSFYRSYPRHRRPSVSLPLTSLSYTDSAAAAQKAARNQLVQIQKLFLYKRSRTFEGYKAFSNFVKLSQPLKLYVHAF